MQVDNTDETLKALTRRLFDPTYTPIPIPGVDIDAPPKTTICINREWWRVIVGMLNRLEYRDAWEGASEEAKQDAVQAILKIIDKIGQHTMDNCEYFIQFLGTYADITLENYTILSGTYNPTAKWISGILLGNGFNYFNVELVVNTHLSAVNWHFTAAEFTSYPAGGSTRLYVDGVLRKQVDYDATYNALISWQWDGTTIQGHSAWVSKIRIDGWVPDKVSGTPDNVCRLVEIQVSGIGENGFLQWG